jgi:hypothetical protein
VRRKLLYVSFLLLLLSLAVLLHWYFDADTPAPKVRVGTDTTYITEPVDADGYLDYQAALNDRLGKDITPDNNANALLWKALGPRPEGGDGMPAEYFKRLGIDEPPRDGEYLIGLSKYLKEQLNLKPEEESALLDQQSWATKRPWAATDYPHIAGWLEANEKPLALAIEATKRPEYFNPLFCGKNATGPTSLIGALIPSVQKCREAASALVGRAMLRVAEGKFDDAWQDLLASHRLARLVARGATLIEDLVGVAIDHITSLADLAYLEHANLSGTQIRERLKDLQALPPFPPLVDKIDLLERFTYLELIQLIRRRGPTILDTLSDGAAKEGISGNARDMEKIDWEPILISGNQWYDRMADALRQKDRAERKKALGQIENDLKALKKDISGSNVLSRFFLDDKARGKAIGDILLSLLMPAVVKVQDAQDRIEQIERNLHVAFALAAYRADNGRYPDKLDDLAPKYLATIPDDLFSGQALHYRPTEQGYLLYSVGVNGVDEGGRQHDDEPPGDDLSVRMPLPELKRIK